MEQGAEGLDRATHVRGAAMDQLRKVVALRVVVELEGGRVPSAKLLSCRHQLPRAQLGQLRVRQLADIFAVVKQTM